MNFKLKSWNVFSWTAMRSGLFRLDNDFRAVWADNRVYILQGEGSDRDRKAPLGDLFDWLVPIGIDFSTEG